MAAYNQTRPGHGPLYTSSIANLNTIPSEYDIALQQQQDGYNMQADLDMFTNTQFFDFDMGEAEVDGLIKNGGTTVHGLDLDFLNATQNYPSFPHLVNPSAPLGIRPHSQHLHRQHHLQQVPQSTFPSSTSSPISATSPQTLPAPEKPLQQQPHNTIETSLAATFPLDLTPSASASASATPIPSGPFEEASRAAAEEDKRRRNTAASARFRVKKKQREQALEKASREMGDKVSFLESRVAQLEMENRLLKELVVEKGGKGGVAGVEALERKVQARKIIGGTTKPGTVVGKLGEEDDDEDDEQRGLSDA